jgi:hypothetical protein
LVPGQGGPVQVDSIKTRVESAPGFRLQSTCLKLKCDEPLSNVAFNFNLRRYTKVLVTTVIMTLGGYSVATFGDTVGRCRLTLDSIKTLVDSAPGFSA